MSTLPNSKLISNGEIIIELFGMPLRAIGAWMRKFIFGHPRVAEIERLNATSDAELAQKGMTRTEAARKILGIHF